ncbi:MAG TPA: hypothetical protein RMH26_32040 [Polyangiaceae bacterium LLY-WYZ-15_(1-7)]|nr:hypothetical protein [Polyangiaceae bacterium LLY-WYZ-15_(1-7)]HJL26388.1 hypothetical protein [Polyangiaceae bacterium LLY-WYZ-15_(1-7)]
MALEEGARVQLAGSVRLAMPEPLRSSLGDRPCAYWDVREGLDDAPKDRGAQPFWLEHAGERVLVRPPYEVRARADRRREVLDAVDADLGAIEARIGALKDQLRSAQGPEASALAKERKSLAKVATLLYTTRAHARGKLHRSSSLKAQEAWIRANAHLVEGQAGSRSLSLAVDRWEVLLEPGDTVAAVGVVGREPLPAGIAGGGGYRERPTCWVLRGLDGEPPLILGVGEAAPRPPAERRKERSGGSSPHVPSALPPRQGMDPILKWTLILVGAAVALAWLLR